MKEPMPFSQIFEHYYGWKRWRYIFQVYNNPVLFFFSNLTIWLGMNNHGKFKAGDYVCINWKARVVIGKSFEDLPEVMQIGDYEEWSVSKSNVWFRHDCTCGCSVFWLRPATKKEIKKFKKI